MHTEKFRAKVLAEIDQGGETIRAICQRHKIATSLVAYWRKRAAGTLKARVRDPGESKDAIIYLRHARKAYEAGNHHKSNLLAMLALECLQESL